MFITVEKGMLRQFGRLDNLNENNLTVLGHFLQTGSVTHQSTAGRLRTVRQDFWDERQRKSDEPQTDIPQAARAVYEITTCIRHFLLRTSPGSGSAISLFLARRERRSPSAQTLVFARRGRAHSSRDPRNISSLPIKRSAFSVSVSSENVIELISGDNHKLDPIYYFPRMLIKGIQPVALRFETPPAFVYNTRGVGVTPMCIRRCAGRA
ncbi:hypothetical protein EVAR_82063_1 [Eumeta japonica]|uniref:Uncharacterized protein n=1 Tax=Eumeta variegata TaxID=151549 RepID=A0A4C1U1R0_EUMVA|nr:hypothetical protein EVAR_82063_1 [Eumeta japonica]